MHNAHAQPIDHAHFRHLTMANNDTKAKKIMVLSSEIIKIVVRSSDILCICCIFWTKGRSLVQEGNCWAWRGGGGLCPVFPTPGSAPDMCRIESQKAMKCVPFAVNVYKNSVGLSSPTNPKPKGQPSISLPAQANLTQQKAEPLRCLALRTRGGHVD